eukprot:GHRQ01024442.1.p4 GENE.GHRQ01024442.1~~GHRQ01024442.1.p4  ORF type:complete len:115 (-),score=9.91 GHRQ01024442.1:692-1036(-)
MRKLQATTFICIQLILPSQSMPFHVYNVRTKPIVLSLASLQMHIVSSATVQTGPKQHQPLSAACNVSIVLPWQLSGQPDNLLTCCIARAYTVVATPVTPSPPFHKPPPDSYFSL